MPIVAMTREMGSLGTFIGMEAARQLGYEFIRQEIIQEAAREYHAAEQKLIEAIEQKPGFLEIMSETFRRHQTFVAAEVYDFALRDRVLIVGRWSTVLLRGVGHAIRVRVSAPLETRVRRVMERLSIGKDQALSLIRQSDEGIRARFRHVFDQEWDNPLLYDLSINTERISLEAGVAQLKALAHSPEFQPTRQSLQHLADLALAAKVKATLKAEQATTRLNVEVTASGGEILLQGTVDTKEEQGAAERLAKGVPGVHRVENQLVAMKARRLR